MVKTFVAKADTPEKAMEDLESQLQAWEKKSFPEKVQVSHSLSSTIFSRSPFPNVEYVASAVVTYQEPLDTSDDCGEC